MDSNRALPALTVGAIGAIGVVFGDIGTSPLYALKEIFNGHHPIAVTPENILGILSLVLYVAMGWLALVAVVPLWRALSPAGFAWLAAGGAAYTLGVVFYAADHRIPHGHGLWHLFVLAGSACHFTTVLVYVA